MATHAKVSQSGETQADSPGTPKREGWFRYPFSIQSVPKTGAEFQVNTY
jgi:hypothetical protein